MSSDILSPRQRECLALARYGKTSLEIAFDLGISRRTVDQYVAEAKKRLGARNRAHAVAEAVERAEL